MSTIAHKAQASSTKTPPAQGSRCFSYEVSGWDWRIREQLDFCPVDHSATGFLSSRSHRDWIFVQPITPRLDFCPADHTATGFLSSRSYLDRIFVQSIIPRPDFCPVVHSATGFLSSRSHRDRIFVQSIIPRPDFCPADSIRGLCILATNKTRSLVKNPR